MSNNLSERHFIRLDGIEISAPIGYYPEERQTGVHFMVSLLIATDLSAAAHSDELIDTINYENLVNAVESGMALPAKLIEHAAYRIKDNILALSSRIRFLRIEIKKLSPPLALKTASATIIIECELD